MDNKNQAQINFRPIFKHYQYHEKIKPILTSISKKQLCLEELIESLRLLKLYSQDEQKQQINNEYKESYQVLRNFYSKGQTQELFAKMANFVLGMEEEFTKTKIKILQQGKNILIELTKAQIVFLLISMAMNLIPLQQYSKIPSRKQKFCLTNSFSFIFSQEQYKTQTLISYFQYHFKNEQWKDKNQKFIIRRKFLNQQIEEIIKAHGQQHLLPYDMRKDDESIEDFAGHGKVDFANQYIGGGALYSGCVQEEIMFANHPELYVSMMLCEVMNEKESIYLQGFRKYSNNNGYGFDTSYDKSYQIDESTFFTKTQIIIAIDAFPFFASPDQFTKEMIDRQVGKAYAGFSNLPQNVDLITGNWGCGVFGGQLRLKFLIQWLACSLAGKKMIYCPFGHGYKINYYTTVLNMLSKKTIGEVYQILIRVSASMKSSKKNIFQEIFQHIKLETTMIKTKQNAWL